MRIPAAKGHPKAHPKENRHEYQVGKVGEDPDLRANPPDGGQFEHEDAERRQPKIPG